MLADILPYLLMVVSMHLIVYQKLSGQLTDVRIRLAPWHHVLIIKLFRHHSSFCVWPKIWQRSSPTKTWNTHEIRKFTILQPISHCIAKTIPNSKTKLWNA